MSASSSWQIVRESLEFKLSPRREASGAAWVSLRRAQLESRGSVRI